jgi:hypothetical protein
MGHQLFATAVFWAVALLGVPMPGVRPNNDMIQPHIGRLPSLERREIAVLGAGKVSRSRLAHQKLISDP